MGNILMLRDQEGCCSICKQKPKDGNRLHIDHDHTTGEVRGLLCQEHNMMLGLAYDNPKILRAAATYLENGGDPSRFYIETAKLSFPKDPS
jgi:hypothetical protein